MRVELPNALFVIFAGVRTAMAVNVGTAPIAFLIGGGGLGELIFTGIDLQEYGMMLAGAIPTALLAVAVDFLFGQAQYWLVPRGVNPQRNSGRSTKEDSAMKTSIRNVLSGCASVMLAWAGVAAAQTIVVGGKAFTEQQIMTAMTVQLLKAKGFTPDRKAGMGSAAVRAALENGQIDVYWEYTGTGLGVFNKITTSSLPPRTRTRRSRKSTARKASSG